MKIRHLTPVESDVSILSINAKVSDRGFYTFKTKDNVLVSEIDGYVPSDLNIGSGDYLELDINLETGQILNWKEIRPTTIQTILNEQMEGCIH